jgi:hypothetical protein
VIEHTRQHGHRPLPFEDALWREAVARLEAVAPLGLAQEIVERQRRPRTTALQGARRAALVGDEAFERGEQKGSKAAALGLEVAQVALLEDTLKNPWVRSSASSAECPSRRTNA